MQTLKFKTLPLIALFLSTAYHNYSRDNNGQQNLEKQMNWKMYQSQPRVMFGVNLSLFLERSAEFNCGEMQILTSCEKNWGVHVHRTNAQGMSDKGSSKVTLCLLNKKRRRMIHVHYMQDQNLWKALTCYIVHCTVFYSSWFFWFSYMC